MRDLRFALRMLLKNPVFTITAAATLAIGIGASTAIYSVVDGVLLRPLPFDEPDRLVMIWETAESLGLEEMWASPPNFADWRDQSSFEAMSAIERAPLTLTEGGAERIPGAKVNAGFFQMLGVEMVQGRGFLPEEDVPAGEPVVVLSHDLWKERFGGADVVGTAISIEQRPHTVVGVAAPGLEFPPDARIWVPLGLEIRPDQRDVHYLEVLARLGPGQSLDSATTEMEVIASRLADAYPATNQVWGVKIVPLLEELVGDTRQSLTMLMGAVVFVLLIACVNVANLLLARAGGRASEIALKTALGASRKRLIVQMLTESLVLALLAGVVGVVLANLSLKFFLTLLPEGLLGFRVIGLNFGVLVFTLGSALAAGLIFGLPPAIQSSRLNLAETLKEGGRSALQNDGRLLRSSLVVAEVALAFTLLVGAFLLIRTFGELQESELGYSPDDVLVMQIAVPRETYPERHQVVQFFQEIRENFAAVQGVETVGATHSLPLSDTGDGTDFVPEGRPAPPPGEELHVNFSVITEGYLESLEIPLMQGRTFESGDVRGSKRVILINQVMAEKHWPDDDPIGKRISIGLAPPDILFEIVGVVGATRHQGYDAEMLPRFYLPHGQVEFRELFLTVQTAGNPRSLIGSLRQKMKDLDSDQAIFNISTMQDVLDDSLAHQRFAMTLLFFFGFVSLVLASVGVYGIVAHTVSQRIREFGVRTALGCSRGEIFKLVLLQGFRLVGLGIGVGLLVAIGTVRFLESQLYGVSASDPATWLIVAALLCLITLAACLAPGRRAVNVDPMTALRYE